MILTIVIISAITAITIPSLFVANAIDKRNVGWSLEWSSHPGGSSE